MVLPVVTLGIIFIALIARITRASMLEVLNEDYIRTARAKGLSNRVVLMRHALRNAAVPILTVIGIGIALLIGGAVVTESVFGLPGLGRLTVEAVLSRDFPTIQAVILLFSVVYVRHQPADRHQLHHLRPEDPLLSAIIPEEVVDSASIAAASTRRKQPVGARHPQPQRHLRRRHPADHAGDRHPGALARHRRSDAHRSGVAQQEAGHRDHLPPRRRQDRQARRR